MGLTHAMRRPTVSMLAPGGKRPTDLLCRPIRGTRFVCCACHRAGHLPYLATPWGVGKPLAVVYLTTCVQCQSTETECTNVAKQS